MGKEKNKPNKDEKLTRREFIHGVGWVVGGAAIASSLIFGACQKKEDETETQTTLPEDVIYSPDTQREVRIPPGQHKVGGWPVLQYGSIPDIDTSSWKFTISGLVENNVVLNYTEFISLPMVKVFSDIHCVTGWSRLNNLWEGPSSRTMADLAGIKPEAGFVIVKAYGGFTSNLTLADFMEKDVLLTVKHDGQPISPSHGAPVRLVVPRLYFWKSAKWLTGLEFTAEDRPGFWESHGYHNHGDPWKEERY